MDTGIETILSALRGLRIPQCVEEYDIHRTVGDALTEAGIAFRHEAPLGPRRRIDFLAGGVGIEIKRARPDRRKLAEQVRRYLESDELTGIIVICQTEVSLPAGISGKPVRTLSLNRLWGLALP